MVDVKVFKVNQEASLPVYSTEQAACFDICACILSDAEIKYYDKYNNKTVKKVYKTPMSNLSHILVSPQDRVLVPTGLIFDIPEGYSIRLHPRSGLSLKDGIILGNCEGVVDSDYINPTFVIIHNTSEQIFKIGHGDRICQGEIVPVVKAEFAEINEAPTVKTNREGGFGSTGV